MDPLNQDRVEKYMAEDAIEAWKTGEWRGRVAVARLMPFLKNEHEKTGPVSKASIAAFILTVSGPAFEPKVKIADILNEEAMAKFTSKAWIGKFTLDDLAKEAAAKGERLTVENIEVMIERI